MEKVFLNYLLLPYNFCLFIHLVQCWVGGLQLLRVLSKTLEQLYNSRAEPKGEALNLPLNLRSHPHLCLRTLGGEQTNEITDKRLKLVSSTRCLGYPLEIW